MRHPRLMKCLLAVALTLSAGITVATAQTYSADTVLVRPLQGVSPERLQVLHGNLRARVDSTFPGIGNLQVVKLPRGLSVEQAVGRYQRSGLVAYAEPDYDVQAVDTIPNDPGWPLWGMQRIQAPAAWDSLNDSSSVVVAVIDTGVRYTHVDLAANMWVNPREIPGNRKDDDANGIVDDVYGANFSGKRVTGNPMDDNGHGAHVAGTIGAVGNNGVGVVGVAWKARIMALKFLNAAGSGSTSGAISCINYVVAMKGDGVNVGVMSNSWGGGGYSQSLYDAIAAARTAGILFVAAAGNSSANNDRTPCYPASYDLDNIISVAATDPGDGLAYFSNFGLTTVDLGAPGVGVTSTYGKSNTAYATMSGTSMATPHVSGAAALLQAKFPAYGYAWIKARLLATTDAVPDLNGKTVSSGRLNLDKALGP